jgi:hypothetical protein
MAQIRKFLDVTNIKANTDNHLKMIVELDVCKPGCQPAIRRFVGERGVTAEYIATSTGKTYQWERTKNGSVIQTEIFSDGKKNIYQYEYDTSGNQIGKRKTLPKEH